MTTPQKNLPTIPATESKYSTPKSRLLYVSHLPRRPSGGGVLAVSFRIAQELDRCFDLHDVGPIVPRVRRTDTVLSKMRRKVFRVPGAFYPFSAGTLQSTAHQIEGLVDKDTDAVFFRSSTRWIHCRPTVPYFVHTDVVFHTFFHNTFDPTDFITSDLRRIWATESAFLEGAAAVFFESEWGLQKARDAYGISGQNMFALRNGGGIDPPANDVWDSSRPHRILTIAKHFRQKGGDLVLDAFLELKRRFPDLEWSIIGGEPEGNWREIPGVSYEGFLRPDNPEELAKFRDLLANAFLLIHPTREDTNPLVLVEAAYFGCPCVSVNDFAIPELVIDRQTGILVDRPVTAGSVVHAIEHMIEHPIEYLDMRRSSRKRAVAKFDWNAIGAEMAGHINRCLARDK
ncbi:MAG: glycosyltransferase family 4 protein [Planctomycetaceae bacterium]